MPSLTVLQSFQKPRPTTNPYVIQLADNLRAVGVDVENWTWRTALLGRFDVFHAHWPEVLVGGSTPLKKVGRQLCYLLFLLRLRVTRRALVRTVHNLDLPRGLSRRETLLLKLTDRWTTLRIALNDNTPRSETEHWALILHGHYRDWFARQRHYEAVPGRFGYFGLIRRYKSVDRLVRAFELIDRAEPVSLVVAGMPSTEDLATELEGLAGADPRVAFRFAFLDDAELVQVATESELVVLPYREMHNSGATLTALSLNRPVLVPDNPVNRALEAEVGSGWLYTYQEPLTDEVLLETLQLVRSRPRAAEPDLTLRDWKPIAEAHVAAYERAVAVAAGGRVAAERD